jgi:hypothetical protein
MSRERDWVEAVKKDIEVALKQQAIIVVTGFRLPYAFQVASYRGKSDELATDDPEPMRNEYQTDLLVAERLEGSKSWIPRVVIEFKFGSVTTHDALTYSAKAATHKNVHPYLRYGFVIGAYEGQVPIRLIRHGQSFDFMVTLASTKLTTRDRNRLIQLIHEEVEASRTISRVLSGKSNIKLFHRKLELRA